MTDLLIRDERADDRPTVDALIAEAFAPMPFSDGSEVAIARRLRDAGPGIVALVAEAEGAVVGQAMLSPATVAGRPSGWFTLGPVAVRPDIQRRGVGSALIHEGLERLRTAGAAGCLVEGDPGYYGRFGFAPAPDLAPVGAPPEYVMALPLGGALGSGRFGYHPAFAGPG